MKAKIHSKDGRFPDAREALKRYTSKVKGDQVATDLMFAISEAESASDKAARAARAQLWTACGEFASKALKTASHSVEMRHLRAECALAADDVEGAVGDLTYVLFSFVSETIVLKAGNQSPCSSIEPIYRSFHADIPPCLLSPPGSHNYLVIAIHERAQAMHAL
jgi:hypothetical protein